MQVPISLLSQQALLLKQEETLHKKTRRINLRNACIVEISSQNELCLGSCDVKEGTTRAIGTQQFLAHSERGSAAIFDICQQAGREA